ncbi:MAG: citrate/2-methylcitrate synthase [Anaerolineales bacterium]
MSEQPEPVFARGLVGIIAAETGLSSVDGANGILKYSGYNIDDLAGQVSYEEVVHLLFYGDLPNSDQLANLQADLAAQRTLPALVLDLIRAAPRNASPMDVLRTAVSALALNLPDASDHSIEATQRKALGLVAQFPLIVAAIERARNGAEVVESDPELDHAANFLYVLTGARADALRAAALNLYLVMLADHSFNASTFTARVAASTNADLHAAIAAAVGALKGNLHGGAAEATMRMLLQIGARDGVEAYVDDAFAHKRKIMGIGHRIYKTGDPRARHLIEWARKMEDYRADGSEYVDMASDVAAAVLRHKELYPNVDFFSAPLLYYLGIPVDLDTCVFAAARVAGWIAHVIEQYRDATLIRPKARYAGAPDRAFTPLAERE